MAIVSPASVTLTYGYDPNVVTTNTSFYTNEGFYFALSELLSGVKDFSTNQENLLILTDNFNLNDKLDDLQEVDKTEFITKSTISFLSGNNTLYLSADGAGNNVSYTGNLSSATIFTLSFTPSGVTLFSSGSGDGGYCVTIFSSFDLNLQLYPRGDAYTTQIFPYVTYANRTVIFTRTTSEVFTIRPSSSSLELEPYIDTNFTTNQVFYFDRFNYTSFSNKGESNLAKYVTTPNNITVSTATSGLPYNYLISTPYQKLDDTLDYTNFNITPLKNYYSPDGVQTPTLTAQLKNYNKIYTGLNTTDGYDKVYLGYKGSEISKVFTKDKDTYFHFPVSATNIALAGSTLVKAGALGGSSPVRSDRLFVKKANYKNYSNWGNYSGTQNGVFFCSWLSASPTGGEAAWMDRYFNPAYVNLTNVLTSTAFTSAANNYPNVIWDVPTTQTFNPESLYIYHRIGDADNQTTIDSFSGTLTRYYKNWTETLINEATGLSAGLLYNYATSAVETTPNTKDESLNTLISYGVTDFTDEELNNNGVTLAFYAQNNDWSNIKGSQLVGNFYNGGIGVSKNNTLLTPFITITGNSILTTNTNLNTLKTTPAGLGTKNYVLKGEYDTSYYIVTSTKSLLVYDQDDLAIKTYNLSVSGDIVGAHLINENNKKQILVFSKPVSSTIAWKKYNTDGTLSTTGTVSGAQAGYTAYTIDLGGTPVYFNSASSNGTVDSNNVVFALSGDVLMRGVNTTPTPVLSALNAEYVACDQNDNIWLLYSKRNLCKLDNYGNVLWDIYLTDAPSNSAITSVEAQYPRVINFIAEINPNNGVIDYKGLVIDPKTQLIFKINPDTGAIEKSTSIVSNGNCNSLGDATGYDYQRKYVYTDGNSNDLAVKAFTRNVNGSVSSEQSINLNYDVSYLTPGQALEQSDIRAIRKRFLLDSFTDLNWSTPTGERYYIEQIERFFLNRLPGAKSNMFNIRIKNSTITDTTLRGIIEKNIIASLSKTIPVHTKLKSIIWD